jgi:ankyrin repeat protein
MTRFRAVTALGVAVLAFTCTVSSSCRSKGKAPAADAAPTAPPAAALPTPAGPSSGQLSEYFRAATLGRWYTINESLKAGVDINARNAEGRTALHLAAANGHDETIGRLITNGANLNIQDNAGNTPLHLAMIGGHDDCIDKLRSRGADQSIRNNQGVPAGGG